MDASKNAPPHNANAIAVAAANQRQAPDSIAGKPVKRNA
jgi:hypothetical protein